MSGTGWNDSDKMQAVLEAQRETTASANRSPHALWLLESLDPAQQGPPYRCLFSNPPGDATLQREGLRPHEVHILKGEGRVGYWRLSRVPWKANPGDLQQ